MCVCVCLNGGGIISPVNTTWSIHQVAELSSLVFGLKNNNSSDNSEKKITLHIETPVRSPFCSDQALQHLNHRTAFVPLIPSNCVLGILKTPIQYTPPSQLRLNSGSLRPYRACQWVVR